MEQQAVGGSPESWDGIKRAPGAVLPRVEDCRSPRSVSKTVKRISAHPGRFYGALSIAARVPFSISSFGASSIAGCEAEPGCSVAVEQRCARHRAFHRPCCAGLLCTLCIWLGFVGEVETQDQFDNLDKHTQWGIDFLEKYAKFVKERIEIEQNYAKQLRNLVKKYCPKRSSKDEEPRFTSCIAFFNILNELNDYAGQREVVAEEMGHRVYGELMRYSHDLKTERKMHLQEGRKAQQYLDMCWKQMDNSKKKFERECREAEKAQQSYERLDNDTNATKADVEKAKQQLNLRTHMADENKNEYAAQLQNFNGEQHKHYYIVIPQIYKQLQEMDERRTIKLSECYKGFADSERKVIPIISKCLEGMILAAKSVDEHRDSQLVIDCFKSGFEPPGDFPFEDYSQNIYRTISDGTISTPKQEGMRIDSKTTVGKAKGKLWLFGKKPKPQSPPLTPTSLYTSSTPNGSQYPIFSIEPVHYCMSDIKTGKPRIPSFRSLKRGVSWIKKLKCMMGYEQCVCDVAFLMLFTLIIRLTLF
ncbi:formin-binding protein 1-like [Meleagris gallopavo]|uniref:formin-binding protein 1-like n=1 Tax=Meleagris gallopavo TaxID=9103 RepID=UPI00093984B6|nr:formin-binding protein 1-like [Meleagris gallopavo]